MVILAKRRKNVGGNRVREWAQENGHNVGARGRFSQELIDAFHRANPREEYTVGHVPTQEIRGIRVTDSGRKVPVAVKATIPEIREFAKANGLPVGSRGRVSAEVKAAFAARPKISA